VFDGLSLKSVLLGVDVKPACEGGGAAVARACAQECPPSPHSARCLLAKNRPYRLARGQNTRRGAQFDTAAVRRGLRYYDYLWVGAGVCGTSRGPTPPVLLFLERKVTVILDISS